MILLAAALLLLRRGARRGKVAGAHASSELLSHPIFMAPNPAFMSQGKFAHQEGGGQLELFCDNNHDNHDRSNSNNYSDSPALRADNYTALGPDRQVYGSSYTALGPDRQVYGSGYTALGPNRQVYGTGEQKDIYTSIEEIGHTYAQVARRDTDV